MSMTVFGYKIENGRAVLDGESSIKVKNLFKYYNEGLSLKKAAEEAQLKITHSSVGRIIRNKTYLGTSFYPPLISRTEFYKTQKRLKERSISLGRENMRRKEKNIKPASLLFRQGKVEEIFSDPLLQAQYAYSLITSEDL